MLIGRGTTVSPLALPMPVPSSLCLATLFPLIFGLSRIYFHLPLYREHLPKKESSPTVKDSPGPSLCAFPLSLYGLGRNIYSTGRPPLPQFSRLPLSSNDYFHTFFRWVDPTLGIVSSLSHHPYRHFARRQSCVAPTSFPESHR